MIAAKIRKKLAGFTLDVELTASAGVTVLFGASGAGKTLTLDCIAGFQRPDEGRILLDDAILYDGAAGVNVRPQRRRCGYVFQNYALFPHLTLKQNLAFAADRLPRLERHRRINEMLEKFKLGEVADRKPDQLSGGQQQRCSIARALIGDPALLLLDEPARGLDAPLRADLYEVIRQVRRDFDIPVLLVTHDLGECFELGEEMFILREGRVVQSGPPSKVVARPASLDVAKLIGLYNLLPAEILQLDPQKNTSLLRVGDAQVTGRYYPGRLHGDKVWLCVPQAALRVKPKNGKPAAHQLLAELQSITERPQSLVLDFGDGLSVEAVREQVEPYRHNKEWVIEFPGDSLHVLSR